MRDQSTAQRLGCEQLPPAPRSTAVTDELNRIRGLLTAALPQAASISFDFTDKLQVHIDLPKREDVILVEALLPNLGAGSFRAISRASTPGRAFHHRISALVNS